MGTELPLSVEVSVRQPPGNHGQSTGYSLQGYRGSPDQESGILILRQAIFRLILLNGYSIFTGFRCVSIC
jgi:hypothetical protein